MHYNQLPLLQTERLILRPVTITDAPDIYDYAKNPEVSKQLPWHPHTSIDETKELINKWIENYRLDKSAPWVIVDKKSQKVIGTIVAQNYDPNKHQVELGYCLSADYWGQGLMVEAVQSVLNYIFTETDIIEVFALIRTDNPQSQRVVEKVGMYKDPKYNERRFAKEQWVDLERWVIQKR